MVKKKANTPLAKLRNINSSNVLAAAISRAEAKGLVCGHRVKSGIFTGGVGVVRQWYLDHMIAGSTPYITGKESYAQLAKWINEADLLEDESFRSSRDQYGRPYLIRVPVDGHGIRQFLLKTGLPHKYVENEKGKASKVSKAAKTATAAKADKVSKKTATSKTTKPTDLQTMRKLRDSAIIKPGIREYSNIQKKLQSVVPPSSQEDEAKRLLEAAGYSVAEPNVAVNMGHRIARLEQGVSRLAAFTADFSCGMLSAGVAGLMNELEFASSADDNDTFDSAKMLRLDEGFAAVLRGYGLPVTAGQGISKHCVAGVTGRLLLQGPDKTQQQFEFDDIDET